MGLLDRWRPRKRVENRKAVVALSNAGYFDDIAGYIKLRDNPEVRIAIDKIADLVSSMTIHLVENTSEGDRRIQNELSRKIDINPCKHMTRKTWIYRIVQDLLLDGEGNALVHISVDPKTLLIKDLTPLDMSQVSFYTKDNELLIQYGDKQFYDASQLIHFMINPNRYDGWTGTGYRITLKSLVNNLEQANKTKNHFMVGEYMPNLIVKVDALSEELASEQGREQVKKKYLKSSKSGEPWVIPAELLDVEKITPLTLNDIAINDSVELDKKTVAGLLGVPAFFLGVGEFDRDEYNNFINTRIMSIAQIIAQTLTRDLLVSPNWYFKLNPRSLYAYGIDMLVEAGGQMVRMNAMRRNELRDWVGLDPDPEMEELIVLENYLPQDQLGNQKKLKGGEDL
ncbi:phage portal protein [Aerococcus sp. UMB8608]|uniref:Phage portal protein n=1 Tax=Aerococcus sanguinicola TaxID=119206 RepID=A0A0X8FCR5_9LACT|nr:MULTISPECIES: phage portal protein [Aerococcus]AMB94907.1 phage portal protein [Aerococcus sanguinicola]MDK6679355.1 phage portal protein [Aerococcus sp. UMB8608]MDK6685803.1 phage portal protein [Aerococcus sp. UMB8623]OFT95892.1 phage portal protein [Aerococcus sp. HMSC23C02]